MDCDCLSKKGHTVVWKLENFILNGCVSELMLPSGYFSIKINEFYTDWSLRIKADQYNNIKCYVKMEDLREHSKIIKLSLQIACVTVDGNYESAHFIEHQVLRNAFETMFEDKWNVGEMLEKKSLYFPRNAFTIRCRFWPCMEQAYSPTEYLMVTDIAQTRIVFQTTIRNFSSLWSSRETSRICDFVDDVEVILYKKEHSKYLSVSVCDRGMFRDSVRLNCNVSIMNSGFLVDVNEGRCIIRKKIDNFYTFPDFVAIEELRKKIVSSDEILNLQFEFIIDSGIVNSRIVEFKRSLPLAKELVEDSDKCDSDSLHGELLTLYTAKKFTDVQLRSGKDTLLAHKVILCARSPVFAAMFETEMAEKQSGDVQIEDVDVVTLDKMLRFMYSGTVSGLDERLAMNLLSAADKYQVTQLKEKCTEYLKSIISVHNACLMFQFADLCSDTMLKNAAQDYICVHHQDILLSDEWRLFVTEHFALACEIIHKLSVKYSNF